MATAAAGDAAIRYTYVDGLHDSGLRGGDIDYTVLLRQTFKEELYRVMWTTDSRVNGSLTFSPYGLSGRAKLAIATGGRTTAATVEWDTKKPDAVAVVHIAGYRVTLPAP